jgi:hypothetical protein
MITLFIANLSNLIICIEMILFRMNGRIPMVRSDIDQRCFFFLLVRWERISSVAPWPTGDLDQVALASVHLDMERSARGSMLFRGALLAKLNYQFFRSRIFFLEIVVLSI